MATTRKSILIAGLGPSISQHAVETLDIDRASTPTIIAAELEKAKAGGFDCKNFTALPQDPAGTLQKLRAELTSQHWDGFSIGFGLRGVKENSALFEDVVNLTMEANPKTKLVFPTGPNDIWEAIRRRFPVAG